MSQCIDGEEYDVAEGLMIRMSMNLKLHRTWSCDKAEVGPD